MMLLSKGRRGPRGRAGRGGRPAFCGTVLGGFSFPQGRPGRPFLALPLPAALPAAALALAALLALPAAALAAQEGTVELGAEVAERVVPPEGGEEGTVELGAAVGLERLPSEDDDRYLEGTVSIGAAVGYEVPSPESWTVAFDAGRGAFDGGFSVTEARGPVGATVGRPAAPKRAGWQFGGWHVAAAGSGAGWDPEGSSAVPLGAAWDFSSPVAGDMTLHARWDLRLDVTLPVAVGFAVNAELPEGADHYEASGPDEGRYALKSRTVRPVAVEEVAVETRESEVGAFFRLPEGALPDGATAEQERTAWGRALVRARLTLTGREGVSMRLPLADPRSSSVGEGGAVWKPALSVLPGERGAFTVAAFDYGRWDRPDEEWAGEERCERLPLGIALGVPKTLEVRTDVDGPKPITHLKLTVSAKA